MSIVCGICGCTFLRVDSEIVEQTDDYFITNKTYKSVCGCKVKAAEFAKLLHECHEEGICDIGLCSRVEALIKNKIGPHSTPGNSGAKW